MALPIKSTPILTGKDAKKFLKRVKEVDEGKHRASKDEIDRMMKNYELIKAKAKFKI